MRNVIVDTCFWYALYEPSDHYHNTAKRIRDSLIDVRYLIPFPTLYEVINTRFSKNRKLNDFKNHIYSPACSLISDEKYKESALKGTLFFSLEKNRPISLVDMIIRTMMEDVNLQIKGLITFNEGDFRDICQQKGIEIIYPQI